jgi:hypothetical protein
VSTVFGEVAGTYDQVRPGYPDEVAGAVLAYHGGVPAHVVELGAGTGSTRRPATSAPTPRWHPAAPSPRSATGTATPTRGWRGRSTPRSVVSTRRCGNGTPDGSTTTSSAAGLFTDVRTEVVRRPLTLARQQYLLLVQTFGPFRRRSPQLRASALEAIGAVLDELGGTVVLDLHTTLVLARRPG